MALNTSDIEQLIEILRNDPELRRRVFVALATDEFLALPAKVDRLTNEIIAYRQASEERFARIEAALERQTEEFVAYRQVSEERFARIEAALERQAEELAAYRQASEERFARIEAALERQTEEFVAYRQVSEERFARIEAALERQAEELAAYRQASEERFARIEAALERQTEELAAYRQVSEERFADISAALNELIRVVTEHSEWLRRLDRDVSQLKGWYLEYHYQKHVHAYMGTVLRRIRVVEPPDVEEPLRQALSNEEVVDVFRADVLARGRLASAPDKEVYLVMEVSAVVDTTDVARARRRADLMSRAGLECLAAVAGQELTEEARLEAQHSRVLCVLDGNVQGWDDALDTLASPQP